MKQVINIYKKHKLTVDHYLYSLVNGYQKDPVQSASHILKQHSFIQLIYAVDENFKQITPIICRQREENDNIGGDKSHYFSKMQLNDNIYISNPYIHYRTGKASISLVHFKDNKYYVYDINLISLLEELKLIEFNQFHDKFKRAVYFLGSGILALISILLIGYGIYIFGELLFFTPTDVNLMHNIFKAIIAVTLGLAIFDLAKQIFEHEVLFQSLDHDEDKQYKVLGKFLISIIIALSIETLLVVFKIALSDNPANLLSAFYLIIGTTMMFVGLGWFYKTIKQSSCIEEE
ncbi:MAG: hypothetical protein PHF17_09420 [Arcobacteraceae bacterium]|jgi:hypothetical protein|nr:hypothetical protein [Arcobacteraceae bacterium]